MWYYAVAFHSHLLLSFLHPFSVYVLLYWVVLCNKMSIIYSSFSVIHHTHLFIENLICIRSSRTYIPLPCILFINRSKQVQMIAAHSFTWKSNLSRYLFKLFNHIIYSPLYCHIVPRWWYLTRWLMSYDDSICLILLRDYCILVIQF